MTRPEGPPGTKWCPGCEQHLPPEDFGRNRTRASGKQDSCKPCVARWWRERRAGKRLVPMPEPSSWARHLAYDREPADPLAIDTSGRSEYLVQRGWVNGRALLPAEAEDVRRRLAKGRRDPHPARPGEAVARRAGRPPEPPRSAVEAPDETDEDYRTGAAVAVLRCRKLWSSGTVTTGDMLEVVGIGADDLARARRWLAEHPEP